MDMNTSGSATSRNLDCPRGLRCGDTECEFRHLDAKETLQQQQQQQQQLNHDSSCIITASRDMGRTASTWVFNAVRLLHLAANTGCDSYWMRELSAPKIRERLQFAASHQSNVLIKTHEFSHYFKKAQFQQDILPLVSHVIVSVRQGFEPDKAWMKHATLVVHYEDIVQENPTQDPTQGSLKVLRQMADHVGLPSSLSDQDLQQVDYQLMTLPIPGDQASKFWSFHARRGGRTCPQQHQNQPQQSTTRRVFVTRHGARLDNGPDRDSRWLSKETRHNRRTDAPLSPLGHVEAKELAQELQKRMNGNGNGNNDTSSEILIVSSPYIRCLETAEAVARHCSNNNPFNTNIKVEPGIAEVGSTPSKMGSEEELLSNNQYSFSSLLDTTYQPVMTRHDLPNAELGDGAAAKRARRVAQTIAQERFPDAGAILFVGHGASCLGLVSAFGVPQEYIGYCSLTEFESKSSSGGGGAGGGDGWNWKLVGELGSVHHLSDPQVSLDSAW